MPTYEQLALKMLGRGNVDELAKWLTKHKQRED